MSIERQRVVRSRSFFAVLLFSSFVSGKFRLLIDFGPGLAEVNKFIWENDENRLENSGTGVTMFN